MASEQIEREDKYDVPEGFVLPDLSEICPGGEVESHTFKLEATYYDTAADDLRRHRITLRRRRGGHDAGWHLKLPAGSGRLEVTVDSQASSPPRELTSMLFGVRRGQRLLRKATLSTTRSSYLIRDSDGHSVAEVVDDAVEAHPLREGASVAAWREIEVELGRGALDLLSRIGVRLTGAGATPAATGSKFARAMGPLPMVRRPGGLAGVVDDYLQVQYDAFIDGDLGLRRDENRIHPTRVAIRRLRSTLRVFAALFEPPAAAHFQTELAWYAGLLGAVRDLDVQAERLAEQLATLPEDFAIGPVAAELDTTLARERAKAWQQLQSALDGRRYRALLDEMEHWRTATPFSATAAKRPKRAADFVERAQKTLRKRLRTAVEHETDDDIFHQARKAAKRYRYANELAEPVLGEPASIAIERAKQLQTLLGEHQDSVVSVALLRRLGENASATGGSNGVTYGVLLAQQLDRAAQTRSAVIRDNGAGS